MDSFMFEQLQPGQTLEFDYPQFDHISRDFTHHEHRTVVIERVFVAKNDNRIVNGLKDGIEGEHRSYNFDLMENVSVAA